TAAPAGSAGGIRRESVLLDYSARAPDSSRRRSDGTLQDVRGLFPGATGTGLQTWQRRRSIGPVCALVSRPQLRHRVAPGSRANCIESPLRLHSVQSSRPGVSWLGLLATRKIFVFIVLGSTSPKFVSC